MGSVDRLLECRRSLLKGEGEVSALRADTTRAIERIPALALLSPNPSPQGRGAKAFPSLKIGGQGRLASAVFPSLKKGGQGGFASAVFPPLKKGGQGGFASSAAAQAQLLP